MRYNYIRFLFSGLFLLLLLAGKQSAFAQTQRVLATSQTNGTSGVLCVNCQVLNPTRAVDADRTNFSTLVSTLSVAQYIEQTLIFPSVNPNPGCDSLVVRMQLPENLLNLNLLDVIGGITVATANGTTDNNDRGVLLQPLIRLLDDNRTFDVILRPQNSFDRVNIRLGGLINLLGSVNIFYAFHSKLNLASTANASVVSICKGSSASLTATPNTAGAVVRWYTQASGGTAVFTGQNYTPAPTANTTYYAETGLGDCTSPTRTAFQVNVVDLPAAPSLSNSNVSICAGDQAILSIASPQNGTQYNWYSAATGGTLVFTGTTFTTAALQSTTRYYVEAVNATGCVSPARTQATATVSPKPASPVVAASATTVSAGEQPSISVTNAQTGITYNWYTSAASTTPVFTGTLFQTPELYASTTYFVEAVGASGCVSQTRTQVTINVNLVTYAPCSFANLESSDINGLCIGCSITDRSQAIDADSTTASTIRITAGLLGAYAEQELRFQQAGSAGDMAKIAVEIPVGVADVSLLSNVQLTFYNGTTPGQSYVLGSLANIQLGGGANRFILRVPATGVYDRIRVRVNSGAATLLSSLRIFYAAQEFPAPVFSAQNLDICSGSTASIAITSPTTGTFEWYTLPTGGTAVFTGTNFTTPALTASATYYVAYTRNGCTSASRYPVQINVIDPPQKPAASFASVTICSGETASLSVTQAANTTINWYDQPTGGNLVFTGPVFVTPALSANRTYYAEAVSGTCASAERTAVAVVVNQAPQSVAVNPASATVDPGQTATFTASSATANTTFNWYTQPTGGTRVAAGAAFTTPALFASATYYLEAVSATGCKAAERTVVNVTVNPVQTAAVPCDAATDQTTDINGLVCIGCTVSNPVGASDANANTFSQLNVGIGLVNAYAQQTLLFPGIGRAGDSVVVEMGVPGTLATVGALSQIQLATYSGNTYNGDRFSVNGSLLSIRLLDGNSRFRVSFPATKDFDRVEIRFRSAVAGVLGALRIYYATQTVAAPAVSAQTVNTCANSQATLTATAPDYVTVKWYTSATGGTAIFTGKTFTTPVLSANTSYFAEATRTGTSCPQSFRTRVDVTVNPVPVAPVITNTTFTICSGQTSTFAATPVQGVTVNWYTSATGGTPVFTGNNFTTPALTANATYYAEAVAGGQCRSTTRTIVNVVVNQAVLNSELTQTSVSTCSGTSATFTASSAQTGVIFRWYETATSTTVIFEGRQFTTPVVTSSRSYYVEAVAGNCTSPQRIKADVIVNPAPAAPTVMVNPQEATITAGETATMTASSTTAGASFRWYTEPAGGTPVFTGATFTTPALSVNTTYYVEAYLPGTGCTSVRTTVIIRVTPKISTSCDFATAQASGLTGVCVNCGIENDTYSTDGDTTNYSRLHLPVSVAGGVFQQLIFQEKGNVGDQVSVYMRLPVRTFDVQLLGQIQVGSFNGTTNNNDQVALSSNLVDVRVLPGRRFALVSFRPQAEFDRIQISLSGLVSVATDLDIYYATKQVEAPELAVKTVNVCSGDGATFEISNARDGIVYEWYSAANGGTPLFTGTRYTTPAITTSTTFYVQSRRVVNDCPNPNRIPVRAEVIPPPPTPVLAQANLEVCAGERVTLSVTNAGTATVRWYNAATGGTLVFTGATFQTPALVASQNYYAEISTGTCTSAARAQATLIVNPAPAKPTPVSTNVQVCSGSPATLAVSAPQGGVSYDWYTTATGGTAVFTGNTFTTPAVTEVRTYYVQARRTTGGCINAGGRTAITVRPGAEPAAPVLSASQTQVCAGGMVSLSVNNPQPNVVYTWYTTATGGTAVFTGPTYTLSGVTASRTLYVQATGASGCTTGQRTSTTINVIPVPPAPQVEVTGGSLSICAGSTVGIRIANPNADLVYRWYTTATGGTVVFTGVNFTSPRLSASTTYYIEASSAGNCNASARTSVAITVVPLPATPVPAEAVVEVCNGSSARLNLASPQAGVTYRWYANANRATVLFEGASYVTPAITADRTFYVDAINSTGCTTSELAVVQVKVIAAPATPQLVNAQATACAGGQVVLQVSNPQAGFTYNWYASASAQNILYTGTSFTTPQLTASTRYYVAAVNAGGCASASRAEAVITLRSGSTPAQPQVAQTGLNICAGQTTTLRVSNAQTGVTYNWYTSATGGTAVFTGTNFTTPALTAATTYYVQGVSAQACDPSARTTVTVNVNAVPAPPALASENVTVCTGNAAVLAVQSPQAGVTYRWYDSPSRTTVLFTGDTYTTAPVTTGKTYYVEALGTGGCTNSTLASVRVSGASAPAVPALINTAVAACQNERVTLGVANPETGVTYNWYTSASGTAAVYTGTTFTTPAVNANVSYYVAAVRGTSCTSPGRAQVNITVKQAPVAPAVLGNEAAICAGDKAVLSASDSQRDVTYRWYTTATGGTAIFAGQQFTTPALSANTTYYVEAVSVSGGCASASRTPVSVAVNAKLAAPVLRIVGTTTSSVTFGWNAVGGAAGYEVSLNNGQSFIIPSAGANGLVHEVTGLQAGQQVNLIVRTRGATVCQTSANSAALTGTADKGPGGRERLFVPNTFTPNGDGRNDVFLAYGSDIRTITLRVYNQWGELYFISRDKTFGWDGTYKGVLQPVGVYVYYVDAELDSGEKVRMKGTVTLLR
ncbi:MAG: gliding motility-associated C-terminal domain-containing protein [Mucilaginibacter polytrichastri]|nr:gliding motility-associated C-terminal domain-containing protein [Mucilaginibacter polytrichastri]